MRTVFGICAVFAIALGVECSVMNLPYWRSLSASTDSANYANALGSGLVRHESGMLEVTDPTQAYVVVQADGSSPYIAAQTVEPSILQAAQQEQGTDAIASTVYLRVSSACGVSDSISTSPYAPRSLYMAACPSGARANGELRVWVEEPAHTVIPISNIRANVHVPFSLSWLQIGLMLVIAAAIWLFRPHSVLWRTALNPSSRRQRAVFATIMAVSGIVVCSTVVSTAIGFASAGSPLVFHRHGEYTYDFDQYGHVADALLHGHTWLDLPVPDALASAADPYDITTRSQLLSDGVTPIYWDYAFHDGHWYSYFGVIPAVLFFLPYQAVTSLWTDGGLVLPSACAELMAMGLFTLFACLLVIRIIQRCSPHVSLAATALLCVAFVLGSDAIYLWYRTNFYSVPFATALMFTMMGLWLWLGAARSTTTSLRHGMWQLPGAPALSVAHVGGGALCIAATLGCRPTFALTAILAFPIFAPQIRACGNALCSADWRTGIRPVIRIVCAMVVPALVVVLPILSYNIMRFGSALDFGNAYQITVTDMTSFRTPLANMPATVFYYLLLPLHVIRQFPWLAISPTPLPVWSFTEPSVCGLLIMAPIAILAFAVPFMRRHLAHSGLYGMLVGCVILAVVLLVFDSLVGGFSWRYMADFGWLLMTAAIAAAAVIMHRFRYARGIIAVAVAWMIGIAVLSCLVVGRDDAMISNNPGFYHMIQAWFSLL